MAHITHSLGHDYEALHSSPTRLIRRAISCSSRRLILCCGVSGLLLFSTLFLFKRPPSFEDVRSYERRLPQHNLTEALHDTDLQPPGRRKYLRIEGGADTWEGGLNNVIQELTHTTYLAHRAKRAFVFSDFVWTNSRVPYKIYDRSLKPTKVPLNAFISGASAGGAVSDDASITMRSISLEFFDLVCPMNARVRLTARGAPINGEDGMILIEWWLKRLKDVENEPCVVLDFSHNHVFDWDYFGSRQPLTVFPHLKTSPTLTHFSWSPLVLSAVARNFAVLRPSDHRAVVSSQAHSGIGGLVAIHLRRGDFRGHCRYLGSTRASYLGLNQHENLPDKLHIDHRFSDEFIRTQHRRHCFPEINDIVEKLRQIRFESRVTPLKRVYVLSNGWPRWLSKLGEELRRDGWEDVINPADIKLDSKQDQVSVAVDMAIAERAEVFVGNGFSSVSANIIMLRLAKGMSYESNRFF
ncbi:hypothetical protein E1B28_005012 [Marasmius oreades]|uniref:Uncharacterized protein n=1 Tax=Marasmius oreades TaxID=181124 RepID=A0A9P7UZV5_9AGAR|nr:uncharacterized protein E1B28_005012 [Marasmius oreades]KAG7097687.1 hypothetical protein E1B28_005012 [Marasmius oreades]